MKLIVIAARNSDKLIGACFLLFLVAGILFVTAGIRVPNSRDLVPDLASQLSCLYIMGMFLVVPILVSIGNSRDDYIRRYGEDPLETCEPWKTWGKQ